MSGVGRKPPVGLREEFGGMQAYEAKHGAIPKGAFVAMRSDWSKRWPDREAMTPDGRPGTRT